MGVFVVSEQDNRYIDTELKSFKHEVAQLRLFVRERLSELQGHLPRFSISELSLYHDILDCTSRLDNDMFNVDLKEYFLKIAIHKLEENY